MNDLFINERFVHLWIICSIRKTQRTIIKFYGYIALQILNDVLKLQIFNYWSCDKESTKNCVYCCQANWCKF